MSYIIKENAVNVWSRDNANTMDVSIATDASSVYLKNGRTIEEELNGVMTSNTVTLNEAVGTVPVGTFDGTYESGVMYGKTMVNIMKPIDDITKVGNGTYSGFHLNESGLIKSLKTNTDYLFVVNVKSNTLTGSTTHSLDFGNTDPNNPNQQACFITRHYLPHNAIGTYKFIMRTRDSFEGTAFVSRNQLLNKVTGGSITFNYMVLEYQEGMENWEIPYFEGLCDVKMPILRNTGKNLFDMSMVETNSRTRSQWDTVISENSIRSTRWGDTTNGEFGAFIRIDNVKPSTTYTLTYEPYINNVYSNVHAYIYNNSTIWGESLTAGSNGTIKFTTKSNTEYITIGLNYGICSLNTVYEARNIQLEESPTSTTYEPHKSNILYTPEIVTLRSLPNGVRDELNLITGEYIKRVGEIYITGKNAEGYYIDHHGLTSHASIRVQYSGLNVKYYKGGTSQSFMCDKLPSEPTTWNGEMEGVQADKSQRHWLWIRIANSKLSGTTMDDIKAWLDKNPLTVHYELEVPIVTKVHLAQSEPIVKIGTELPNGVCDTYNLLTGEHVQRVGKVVLDGSEVWKNASLTSNNGQYYVSYCPLSSMKKYTVASGVVSLISDKFVAEPPVGDDEAKKRDKEFIASYGSNATVVDGESNWIYLSVEKGKIANNTGIAFANYLKSNPVTVWYELKNPIVTKKNGFPNTHGITLPNGEADKYIESTGLYTQNLGKVIIDGSQDLEIVIPTSGSIFFIYKIETALTAETRNNIVSNLPVAASGLVDFVSGRANGTGFNIYVGDQTINTVEKGKQYFASNPVHIYYPLVTPKTVNIPIINVGQVLPNGVCDTYNPITKEYIKRVKEVKIDSSYNLIMEWASSDAPNTRFFSITGISDCNSGSRQITSNYFSYGESSMDDIESILYNHSATKISIEILKSRLESEDLDGVKKWLDKNNLIVWYELATPEVSTVDLDLSTLYSSSPIAYENGHVILESGYGGQSLLPTLEYDVVVGRCKQIESISQQILRQEKQITMLQDMLIKNIVKQSTINIMTMLTMGEK